MDTFFSKILVVIVLSVFSLSSLAETFYEVSIGAGQLALDIDQKRGAGQIEDDSSVASFAIAAYRHSSSKTAWGAVIEYSLPISREDDLPGSGRIVGFRPLNYLRNISDNASLEVYAGAAQYQWRQTANGYLFGLAYRYNLFGQKAGLVADFKYYQDLSYDFESGSDIIVDGFNSNLKLFYRF